MTAGRAILIACVSLVACGRQTFDHAREAAALHSDASAPAVAECEGVADGTRCDDHDACTPSSSCRLGVCVPGNSFGDCTIADSDAELGLTQGDQGWFYGYWQPERDPDGSYEQALDFIEMEYCGESAWRPGEVCGLERDDPAFRWTQNLAWGLQHPETDPELELPIRRWVSDTSGPATLSIAHQVGGTASDGTRAILVIDDREVWRNDAVGGDDVGSSVSMQVELAVGMVIDQLVHPLSDSADDTTYFVIRLEGL